MIFGHHQTMDARDFFIQNPLERRITSRHICNAYTLFSLGGLVEEEKSYTNQLLQEIKEELLAEAENICLRELRHVEESSCFYDVISPLALCYTKYMRQKRTVKDKSKIPSYINNHLFFKQLTNPSLSFEKKIEEIEGCFDTPWGGHNKSCYVLFYDFTKQKFDLRMIVNFHKIKSYLSTVYSGESDNRNHKYFSSFLTFEDVYKKTRFRPTWEFIEAFFRYGGFGAGYGGSCWARFARHCKNLNACQDQESWFYIDRVFNFVHNSGRFVNKFFYEENLRRALTLHSKSKRIVDVARHADSHVFSLYKSCKTRYPELLKNKFV